MATNWFFKMIRFTFFSPKDVIHLLSMNKICMMPINKTYLRGKMPRCQRQKPITSAASMMTVAATITAIIAMPLLVVLAGGSSVVGFWLVFAGGITLSPGTSVVMVDIEISVEIVVVVSMAISVSVCSHSHTALDSSHRRVSGLNVWPAGQGHWKQDRPWHL